MVARNKRMTRTSGGKGTRTLHIIYPWRIVDGLSASGGDPIHVNVLTYFYDILQNKHSPQTARF
jgi:hypothetical protein